MMPKLTGVSRGWPPLWILLRWTDLGSEPVAGGFGEEGFCVGQTVPGGAARKCSAPGFGEAEVCWRGPRWSLVCDTAAPLALCMGRREWSTVDEWCISTCCQLAVQCTLPNKMFRPGTKTWHEWGNVPLVLQNVFPCKWKTGTTTHLFIPIQRLKTQIRSIKMRDGCVTRAHTGFCLAR